MKKIKSFVKLLAIVALVLSSVIGYIVIKSYKNNQSKSNNNINENKENEQYSYVENITSQDECFTVLSCIKKYEKVLIQLKGANDTKKEKLKEKLYNLISKEYINKNKINKENLFEHLRVKSLSEALKINAMNKEKGNTNVEKYYIYAYAIENNNGIEYNFTVLLDKKNKTFAILEEVRVNNPQYDNILINKIEENVDNSFDFIQCTHKEICSYYFSNFVEKLKNDSGEAYENLDEDCRYDMFGSYINFKKYISQNYESVNNLKIKDYKVNSTESHLEYVCRCTDNQTYTFVIEGGLKYKVYIEK